MPRKWRRFELFLPIQFTKGNDLSLNLLGGAATGHLFVEGFSELTKVVVDLPDTANNRKRMRAYRDHWKVRLAQKALWLVSYAVRIE